MNILQAIKTFGQDALKEIELPVSDVDKVFLVLTKGAADAPEVATVVRTLVTKALTLGAAGSLAVAADGINIPDDLAVLADAKDLYSYVKATVIPTVEKTWDDLAASLNPAAPAASDPVPAKAAVAAGQAGIPNCSRHRRKNRRGRPPAGAISGPGLHVMLNQ